MHRYLPHTEADRTAMLSVIGVASMEDLLSDIPAALRCAPLQLPAALSEWELDRTLRALAGANKTDADCYLGGGVYDRFIPAIVPALVSRQEFATAYTPYQAEMSQGTLQAIFEYQTMIASLMGHAIANASMYDGASAAAEAVLMACRATGRNNVVLAGHIAPQTRAVCDTYAQNNAIGFTHTPAAMSGCVDGDALRAAVDGGVAAVVLQSPNALGVIEDMAAAAALAHDAGALLIVIADPVAMSLLTPPGQAGADIAVGEGQQLGNAMNFGGPGFGFMTATAALLRRLPGRIVGETADAQGNRGFVLTMQAREQHIRRDKATSNICSNQALCTLAATVYMTAMGPRGLRQVAENSTRNAHYLQECLLASGLFTPAATAPFLYEFAVTYTGEDFAGWQKRMCERGILPGIDLGDNTLLVAVTEKYERSQLDRYAGEAVRV